MSTALITTGIDQLAAQRRPEGGWTVSFRSVNQGLHHQLYVNGRLAGWTDTTQQRQFDLDETPWPAAVTIAAVPAEARTRDLAADLPPADGPPSWIFRTRIVRSLQHRRGDAVEVLSDRGTGQLSEVPLARAEIWPAWMGRWGFGEDAFARGAFGLDGTLAPGLGQGTFGVGPFGLDADLIELEAVLENPGIHQVVLRTLGPDGRTADSQPILVNVCLPASIPTGLAVHSYDHQAHLLTLEIN